MSVYQITIDTEDKESVQKVIDLMIKRGLLKGINFEGADLFQADLKGASLYAAYLAEADLSLSTLRDANLFGADLTGATLEKVKITPKQLSEIIIVDE